MLIEEILQATMPVWGRPPGHEQSDPKMLITGNQTASLVALAT